MILVPIHQTGQLSKTRTCTDTHTHVLNLLTIVFVHRKRRKNHSRYSIVSQIHPLFFDLTLPWYIPAPLRGAVLYGAYTGRSRSHRREKGARGEESRAAGMLFLEM